MRTKIITTIDELECLREDWRLLLQHIAQSEIFDSWEWNRIYLRNVKEDCAALFIIAVYDQDQCVGIAPLMYTVKSIGWAKLRVLHPINPSNKDYCSFYIHQDYRYVTVFKQFIDEIARHRSHWDYLQLTNFSSNNQMTYLAQTMLAGAFDIYSEELEVVPYVNLQSYSSLKTNNSRLKSIERKEKKLRSEQHIEIGVNKRFDEQVWLSMIELHCKRWPHSPLRNPSYIAFYHELCLLLQEQDQLEFSYLKIEGRLAAGHLGFNTPEKTYYYMPTFDQDQAQSGAGLILLMHMMKHYQAQNKLEFDFLRGDESYKFYWADQVAMNYRIHIFNNSFKMRIVRRLVKASIYLRQLKHLTKGLRHRLKSSAGVTSIRGADNP